MNLVELRQYIDQEINTKTNSDKITGASFNAVLHEILSSLIDICGTGFGGPIAKNDNPGAQTNPIYFIAKEKGIYTYCSGVEVTTSIAFIVWDGDSWSVLDVGLTADEVNTHGTMGLVYPGTVMPPSPKQNDWYVFVGGSLTWGATTYTEAGVLYYSGEWHFIAFGGGGDLSLKADLVDGKVPTSQLPSFVDDVIEGIYYPIVGEVPAYFQVAGVTITPESGKIYVSTDTNTSYRWSGTTYVSISNPLAYSSQSEAETGTENTKVMTALRVVQSIVYQLINLDFPGLATTSKKIITAINEINANKSTKITLITTAWNTAATSFTLECNKRYDFGGTQCVTTVTWSFTTPADSEDYEYWFKIAIGTGGTSHNFMGCTLAPNNDTIQVAGVYEISIKRSVVFIRRDNQW